MATSKKSRLAEIYRSEKKKGGGVASTLGKAAVEKIDPRQIFNQQGFLAAAFPALFKAYKAAPGGIGKKITKLSTPTIGGDFGALTKQITSLTTQMHEVAVNSTIIAKNTMVLPAMARDTNIIRQNISKLVKIQGDSAAKKADMFFKRAQEREAAYESKFKKEGGRAGTTTATVGTPPATVADQKYSGLTSVLKVLADSMSKGVGIAALGVGIGGFFAGLAAGGAAVTALGGASGVKDMMINLAEGLKAFDGDSFLKLSALLGAGALFGTVTGLSAKGGAMLGMGAIGTGIGLFFSGLSVGGAIGDMIGNSAGIKNMMTNFAEGLNAFNPSSLSAFTTLLAAGGIFGVVAGVASNIPGVGTKVAAGIAGGMTLGIGAIGLGIGLFLAGLAAGDKLIEFISSGSSPGASIKDLLINVSTGIKSFESIDADKISNVAKILPELGSAMLKYFGSAGLGGIISTIGDKMNQFLQFVFGIEKSKSPIEKLSEDLQKFNSIDAANLSNIGKGFRDLIEGFNEFSRNQPTVSSPGTSPGSTTPALPFESAPTMGPGFNRMAGASTQGISGITPAAPAPAMTPPISPGGNVTSDVERRLGVTLNSQGRTSDPRAGQITSSTPTPAPPETTAPAATPFKIEDYIQFTERTGSKRNFELLNPKLKDAVIAAAVDYKSKTGKKLVLESGVRTDEDQQRLWNEAVAFGRKGPKGEVVTPSGHTIAPPGGYSSHGYGLAVDIRNWRDPEMVAALNRAGLFAYIRNDPVHFQLERSVHADIRKTSSQVLAQPQTPQPASGTMISSASSNLSANQLNASAPNITVVAPSEGTTQVASATIPMAVPVDRELNRRENLLLRQTSFVG